MKRDLQIKLLEEADARKREAIAKRLADARIRSALKANHEWARDLKAEKQLKKA